MIPGRIPVQQVRTKPVASNGVPSARRATNIARNASNAALLTTAFDANGCAVVGGAIAPKPSLQPSTTPLAPANRGNNYNSSSASIKYNLSIKYREQVQEAIKNAKISPFTSYRIAAQITPPRDIEDMIGSIHECQRLDLQHLFAHPKPSFPLAFLPI